MGDLAIFEQGGAVSAAVSKRGLSDLAKSIPSGGSMRRIQTNTNGTFKRLVGGEQIGKAIRGEFNAIIVAMLPKVSRSYYAADYDPDGQPTLPDCWSNLGDKPEANTSNPQATSCAACPQNIEGSGTKGKGRACRFQRRVALLLEGDSSGDVYQFNIPAKSLFGKGNGNVHPFESYVRYLVANEHSIDYVVTKIAYDLDAETMELNFTPLRPITDEELDLVEAVQVDPETKRYIQLTVAEASGVKKEPVREAPAYKPVREAPAYKPVAEDDEDAEEKVAPPVKRGRPAKAMENPAIEKKNRNFESMVNKWLEDTDEEAEDA